MVEGLMGVGDGEFYAVGFEVAKLQYVGQME